MRFTLLESKYLKDSILIISELVNEANIHLMSDRMELIAMDPANVAMVVFRLLSSAFSEYNLSEERTIGINLGNFTQILRRVKPTDSLTLEIDDRRNRLNVILRGTSTKKFELALLDIDQKEQKIPSLKFNARVETNALIFNDMIEDMDVIGDSLSFSLNPDKFIVLSEGNVSSGRVEVDSGEDTNFEVVGEPVSSRYSIEYLKKITKGSKLANKVLLEFGQDYPLKTSYNIIDKLSLSFILAPRQPVD